MKFPSTAWIFIASCANKLIILTKFQLDETVLVQRWNEGPINIDDLEDIN